MSNLKKVALFGNPNTGKSSLFNRLTGLRQKVGNFPGVTIDKSEGIVSTSEGDFTLLDFPGSYSVYPKSPDEEIVYNALSNTANEDHPDALLVVVDASNLKRNLLLFSQLYDLGIPIVLALNMIDVAKRRKIDINLNELSKAYPRARVVSINARIGLGIKELINETLFVSKLPKTEVLFPLIPILDKSLQDIDTKERYDIISNFLPKIATEQKLTDTRSYRVDRVLTHPILGYFIFAFVMLFIFQSVFTLASYPMDWIEMACINLSELLKTILPKGPFFSLLTDGIIPGISGVLVFIPQIALLFFILSILEETGYMTRIAFIMDRIMRPFGLNGKSIVPLISSAACAIPGIMAARTISSRKERLITILVAPLMSCSARIPVYALLIALVIPNTYVAGVFNLQGLVMTSLYFLGIVAALLVAFVINLLLKKNKEQSMFFLELPVYRGPKWSNVYLEVWKKMKVFVVETGKIILAISITLWFLANYGPGNAMEKIDQKYAQSIIQNKEDKIASEKLEKSYLGIIGKTIEPAIKPLGYDWKIGIALLASFAAREVFVGSLSTIYSVHQDENIQPLLEQMEKEKYNNGKPIYSLACGLSLLVFYAFAMQCMATLAVVKRELKSWKWPIIQLTYMFILAYLSAYVTFNLAS